MPKTTKLYYFMHTTLGKIFLKNKYNSEIVSKFVHIFTKKGI